MAKPFPYPNFFAASLIKERNFSSKIVVVQTQILVIILKNSDFKDSKEKWLTNTELDGNFSNNSNKSKKL